MKAAQEVILNIETTKSYVTELFVTTASGCTIEIRTISLSQIIPRIESEKCKQISSISCFVILQNLDERKAEVRGMFPCYYKAIFVAQK